MSVCGTPWRFVDVGEVWEAIAHRIPAATPDPDDIRTACEAGEAICLESADGVLIFTLVPSEHGLELFVLLCVGYSAGAFQRRDPDLDLLAADLGATAIVMCPRRRGWARLLGANWIRRGDVYMREVIHGGQTRRNEADATAAGAG